MTTDDRDRITNLLVGYATAIDTKDWALFESLFVEDSLVSYEVDNAAAAGGGLEFRGARQLTESMEAAHRNLDGSLHRMNNIVVKDVGDQTARVSSYVDAILVRKAAPGGSHYRVHGRYDDDLVRRDGNWQFEARRFSALLTEGNEFVNEL